jgi:hypothetical protein
VSEIIDFASAKKERAPHWSGSCVCLGCRHEWVGVGFVPFTGNLDCPSCELPKGTIKYSFGADKDDLVLTCSHCHGEALTAYVRNNLHYVRCMGCGVDLTDVFFSGS